MKKITSLVLATIMLIIPFTGCLGTPAVNGNSATPTESVTTAAPTENTTAVNQFGNTGSTTATTQSTTPAEVIAMDAPITVISREDGSGTRGAFIELFGVQDENKVDNTLMTAEITNSTSVMMTSVAGDPGAIGYISLGSLNNTVKASKIDGVDATVDNINSGSYKISRPFNIAIKEPTKELSQDFIQYIMSTDGQDIIESNGYIRVQDAGSYNGAKPAGKIIVAGSSSVTPVMEKLIESYLSLNTSADIELQTSDSSTGMNSAIDGISDIGMASRELKDSEHEKGLTSITIAMDGIAVIVNNDNPTANLTKDQGKLIYTGEISNWSEIG